MKSKIAIIGGGISGVSAARMLSTNAEVVVFERQDKIGGLIRCDNLNEGLYHKLGGHVFNTKSAAVSKWFWSHFDKDKEFYQLNRNAKILFGSDIVGYPIENHLYQLPGEVVSATLNDLLAGRLARITPGNFKEALLDIFGPTLCSLYFFPYNEKIWRKDLAEIPVGWLEGKLPMPDVLEILHSNIFRKQENKMVHAQFYYPKEGGSQFIVDRLAKGLDTRLLSPVFNIEQTTGSKWLINGNSSEPFDRVICTADIRSLARMLPAAGDHPAMNALCNLRTRGITNVFCECDPVDISWLYLPEKHLSANRIIYTGGFSPNNNRTGRMTCVVEFAFGENPDAITRDIKILPGNLKPISSNHVKDAYVIQEAGTRMQIAELKQWASVKNLHLLGRFAEWEYYNIDKAIEAAQALAVDINSKAV